MHETLLDRSGTVLSDTTTPDVHDPAAGAAVPMLTDGRESVLVVSDYPTDGQLLLHFGSAADGAVALLRSGRATERLRRRAAVHARRAAARFARRRPADDGRVVGAVVPRYATHAMAVFTKLFSDGDQTAYVVGTEMLTIESDFHHRAVGR